MGSSYCELTLPAEETWMNTIKMNLLGTFFFFFSNKDEQRIVTGNRSALEDIMYILKITNNTDSIF